MRGVLSLLLYTTCSKIATVFIVRCQQVYTIEKHCNLQKQTQHGLRLPAAASFLGRNSRLAGRGPSLASLFPPQAAVGSAAAMLLTRTLGGRVRANFFIWNLVLPGLLEGRKGGCTMTFEQVVLLLTLLGGAIYVTFEITWTVSHSDDKKKK